MSDQESKDIRQQIADDALEYAEKLNNQLIDEEKLVHEFNTSLTKKALQLAKCSGQAPAASKSQGDSSQEDYSKVFEIIKSQEKQFVSQLSETRKFASTWLLGTLGGISVLLVQKQNQVLLIDQNLLISLIAIMGALGLCMLWVLDRKVYHRLLNATILEGLAIENNIDTDNPNNVPTKVRTHTLRITGQLGLPIAIFYLFPISFLLFISYSFHLKFLPFYSQPYTGINIVMPGTYLVLIFIMFCLSFPTPFSSLAENIKTLEQSHDCSTKDDWEKLICILDKIKTQRNSDRNKAIGWSLVAFALFLVIIKIYAISLYLDSNQIRLKQEQPLWDARLEIVRALGVSSTNSNPLKIEVKAKLNANICEQLSLVSNSPFYNQVNPGENCTTEDFGDKKIQINLEKQTADTSTEAGTIKNIKTQLALIENILKINGIKPISYPEEIKADMNYLNIILEQIE